MDIMENTVQDQAPLVVESAEITTEDTLGQNAPLVTEDEETIEASTDEQVEPPVVEFAGRSYKDISEAERSYKEMQQRATKAEQALLKAEREQRVNEEKSKLAGMSAEEKLDYLATQQAERMLAEQYPDIEADAPVQSGHDIQAFIMKHPEISDYGLNELFNDIAQREDMLDYTLESIYDVKFKPLIAKVAGTKVTRKKRPISSAPADSGASMVDVSGMSPMEYEKHRATILAKAGIKYK